MMCTSIVSVCVLSNDLTDNMKDRALLRVVAVTVPIECILRTEQFSMIELDSNKQANRKNLRGQTKRVEQDEVDVMVIK